MPSKRLLDYIAHCLERGHSKKDIRAVLLSHDWEPADVDEAFFALEIKTEKPHLILHPGTVRQAQRILAHFHPQRVIHAVKRFAPPAAASKAFVESVVGAARQLAFPARRTRNTRSPEDLFFHSPPAPYAGHKLPTVRKKDDAGKPVQARDSAWRNLRVPAYWAAVITACASLLMLVFSADLVLSRVSSFLDIIPASSENFLLINLRRDNPERQFFADTVSRLSGSDALRRGLASLAADMGFSVEWQDFFERFGFEGEVALGTIGATREAAGEGPHLFLAMRRKNLGLNEFSLYTAIRRELSARYLVEEQTHKGVRIFTVRPRAGDMLPLGFPQLAVSVLPGAMLVGDSPEAIKPLIEEVSGRGLWGRIGALFHRKTSLIPRDRENMLDLAKRETYLALYGTRRTSQEVPIPAIPSLSRDNAPQDLYLAALARLSFAEQNFGGLARLFRVESNEAVLEGSPTFALYLLRSAKNNLVVERYTQDSLGALVSRDELQSHMIPERISGRYVDVAFESDDSKKFFSDLRTAASFFEHSDGVLGFAAAYLKNASTRLAGYADSDLFKEYANGRFLVFVAPDFSGGEPILAVAARITNGDSLAGKLAALEIPAGAMRALLAGFSEEFLALADASRLRDEKRELHVSRIREALSQFFAVKLRYPVGLRELEPSFLASIPADPATGISYLYAASGDARRYTLEVVFERGKRIVYTEEGSLVENLQNDGNTLRPEEIGRKSDASAEASATGDAMRLFRLPIEVADEPKGARASLFFGVSPTFFVVTTNEEALRDIASSQSRNAPDASLLGSNAFFKEAVREIPERVGSFYYLYTHAPWGLYAYVAPKEDISENLANVEKAYTALFPTLTIADTEDRGFAVRRFTLAVNPDAGLPDAASDAPQFADVLRALAAYAVGTFFLSAGF